jgi:hypothetical protein
MLFNQDENEPFRYTEAEAAMVARLAEVKVAADNGNRKAKAQIAKVLRQLAALQKLAKRGNARAARQAQVLEESGILAPSQTFAMEGATEPLTPAGVSWNPWTWSVGNARVLPIALGVTAGVLAYMRKWGWAAAPLVVWGLHEGHQKKWW